MAATSRIAGTTSSTAIQKCHTTARADMTSILGSRPAAGLVSPGAAAAGSGLVLERLGDPRAEVLGHGVAAPLRDDDAQLGLEVVRLEARQAVVEMSLDPCSSLDGQLAVDEGVELAEDVVAIT